MTDVQVNFEPYDHEILAIEKVPDELGKKVGTVAPLESFRKECIDRFAEAGIVATVVWYTDNKTTNGSEEVFSPIIYLNGRTDEHHEFDYDRQVFEVRNDILDILPPSEKGAWIKSEKGLEVPQHHH